jgi:phenylacetic acid degradation protein PaaN
MAHTASASAGCPAGRLPGRYHSTIEVISPDSSRAVTFGSTSARTSPSRSASSTRLATSRSKDLRRAVVVGNPADESVRMGALASLDQREEVRRSLKALEAAGHVAYGDPEHIEVTGADDRRGAFMSPVLLVADEARRAEVHEVEAFGPVATLIGYRDTADVIDLAGLGKGSLAGSVVTDDPEFAREVVLGTAPWHGRLLVLDSYAAPESTGHGSPLPTLVHGGPGRAGGGEEMGGLRGVHHHMQRTAIQASPRMLQATTGRWVKGAAPAGRWRPPVHQAAGDAAHRRHRHRRPAYRDAGRHSAFR